MNCVKGVKGRLMEQARKITLFLWLGAGVGLGDPYDQSKRRGLQVPDAHILPSSRAGSKSWGRTGEAPAQGGLCIAD